MSLFSSFDLYFFSVTSFSFIILIAFLISPLYRSSVSQLSVKQAMNKMQEVINSFIPFQVSQGSLLLLFSVFTGMLVVNLFSVNSYNFPLTSQMSVILFAGLSLWLSFTIFSTLKNYLGAAAHLIPEGAPIYMAFALMIIEFVSLMIRPLTLSIRMMANILAGHLLMILLSSLVFKFQSSSIFYLALNLIEIFVAVIQSYILTVMLTLYYSDAK